MKVFGIGLNKTGTSTLAACLQELGFRHTSCNWELTKAVQRKNLSPVFEHADRYESFEDWPWPLIYEELDQRYDEAKFILTRRASPEVWFSSLKRHALRTGPTKYRKIAYGHEMPLGKKQEHIRQYRAHNSAVRRHFEDREEKLLEVCWEEGDAWTELCEFVGRSVPNADFPHEKKGRSKLASYLSYARGYVRYQLLGRWGRLESL
ncbi:sulfotransferase family protein [Salinibacter ruber]|uniref:sulfotransferase family protein n=1 Tax=Salinibacter ruber TaxID=146919 RepID=UPI0020734ED2|nr:sulfotransferase family protein [Salinibacter ruber]